MTVHEKKGVAGLRRASLACSELEPLEGNAPATVYLPVCLFAEIGSVPVDLLPAYLISHCPPNVPAQAGRAMMCDCQPRRDHGVACSRLVGSGVSCSLHPKHSDFRPDVESHSLEMADASADTRRRPPDNSNSPQV